MVHVNVSQVRCFRLIDEKNEIKRCLYYGMTEIIKFECDCEEIHDHVKIQYYISSSQNACRNRFELWCVQTLPYFISQTTVVEINSSDWQQMSRCHYMNKVNQ